jgi:hypothetical protein
MSLEQAMANLTAALEANTATMENLTSASVGRTGGKSGGKPGGKPGGKSKKKVWESEDTFLAACTAFLKFSEEKADRPKLKAAVKPILEHFGVAKFSAIDRDSWQECHGYIVKLQAAVDEDGIDGLDDVDLNLSSEDGDDGLI